MKKFLIYAGLFAALIIGAGTFLKLKGTDLITHAIQTNGSALLGADISLGGISLNILKGHAGLSNLSIGQPEGFGSDNSFHIEEFAISLKPLSLFDEHVKIDTILIDKASLNLVMTGTETNFTKLQSNLSEVMSTDSSSSDVKISIKDLKLNQTHLRIQSDKYGEKDVTLADVHLENIGVDENGVAPAEAVRLTLDALKPQIAKALIELGIKDKINEEVDKQLDDKLKDLPTPLADKLKSGLGGLLKKKKKD